MLLEYKLRKRQAENPGLVVSEAEQIPTVDKQERDILEALGTLAKKPKRRGALNTPLINISS
jgi:hypothetical protein